MPRQQAQRKRRDSIVQLKEADIQPAASMADGLLHSPHTTFFTSTAHGITMGVTTALATTASGVSRAKAKGEPIREPAPSSRDANGLNSRAQQVKAAAQRLRHRILSAGLTSTKKTSRLPPFQGDENVSLEASVEAEPSATKASLHSPAAIHLPDDKGVLAFESCLEAAPSPAQSTPASPVLHSHLDLSPGVSAAPAQRAEPSLYEAIFGPAVARQLQAAAAAAAPKTPPRTPVAGESRSTFRLVTTPRSSSSSRSDSSRSGVSARLHRLSSMPQLGSPERARRGGPPAGLDLHNEPTQTMIDHEEEMAFSHPHQSFVVYSPRRPSTATVLDSPNGKRKRGTDDDPSASGQRAFSIAPTTPRNRKSKSTFGAAGTLHNGHPATPLAYDLGLTSEGRRSRQSSAVLLTPHVSHSSRGAMLHGGRAETDQVAGMLAALAEERKSHNQTPVALTPTRRPPAFADPSSITPRKAGLSHANGTPNGLRPMNPGSAASPSTPAPRSTPVSEGDALAVNVLLGFSNSPVAPQSHGFGSSTPLPDAGVARLTVGRHYSPQLDRSGDCESTDTADTSSVPTQSTGFPRQMPRTPSPTPSSASAVPETPKTPNTSSAFAYSEYVNVSPSPQPRSRGPSGRFITFAEGSGWADDDEESLATQTERSSGLHQMSPSASPSRRRSRQYSRGGHVLSPGPLVFGTPPRRSAGPGTATPQQPWRDTAETSENVGHGIYTPLRRHHASIALPLNAGFVSPVVGQLGSSSPGPQQPRPRQASATPSGHRRKRSNVTFDLSSLQTDVGADKEVEPHRKIASSLDGLGLDVAL